ncbi:MAG: biotin transporter BioY [Clostridia bacterium]|nr:biotin transporter BioY [Clostridia bacterium]
MKPRKTRTEITKNITLISLSAAFLAVCSYISVPFLSGISFTLQLFAVFFTAGALDLKKSLSALLLYISAGVIGLPVFSSFRSGISVLLGPTGGYIIAFIPSVIIIGLSVRLFGKKTSVLVLSMLSSLAVCYIFGTFWFLSVYEAGGSPIGLTAVLSVCVLPYVLPDAAKIALAVYLCRRFEKFTDSL